jgi:hypothetical protein
MAKKTTATTRFTKTSLPEKICIVCLRPMQWRKKWEKVWAEVKYCSDACRQGTPRKVSQATRK